MALPRIFVSHASADRVLTDAVEAELKSGGEFELLLDNRRLEAGWAWEPFLHEWMARCDAGLLLLTEHAVASDYVLKEATILAWRMSLDAGFPFFVARDRAVVDDEMLQANRFTPVRLDRIQSIRTLDAAEIARQVRTGLAGHAPAQTPFDKLVSKLADLLADSGSQAIADIADRLGVVEEWRPASELRTRHVEAIARHLICGELTKYGRDQHAGAIPGPHGLRALIGDLADTTSTEHLKTILRMLSPHWVDGESAGKFALLPRHVPRRALGLNGRCVQEYTAPMFLDRGHLDKASNYGILPVGGANAGGFVDHYTTEICAAYAQDGFDWLTTDELIDTINHDATRYVVIPPPVPDPADLGALLDRFPGVNFVLWTGESLERLDGDDRIDWADPPIDPAIELEMRTDYEFAKRTIREKEAGP